MISTGLGFGTVVVVYVVNQDIHVCDLYPPEMGNLDGAAGATSSSSLEFGREALGAGVIANQKYT